MTFRTAHVRYWPKADIGDHRMVGKRSVIKHRLLTVALNVSFTDVKAEINMLDTLQFLFVAHMSRCRAQHSDVFLTTSCVGKTKSARCVWAGSSRCREFPLVIGAVTTNDRAPMETRRRR